MFKKKILVVDDSELIVKLIHDVLKSAGYDVAIASNGEDGLKKVKVEKPDLIVLDGVMPGISGFEVCKILRDDISNNLMPIIMLTAQENEEDKITGLELGADDYIVKPFNHRELLSRVKNTLKRIERNRSANPLTGLDGNIEIATELNHRIILMKPLAVVYLDLDNFKAYNDVYGFANGDTVIKLTADVLKDSVKLFGNGTDFIGHVGGDDFVIITTPDKVDEICRTVIEEFDIKILSLYSKEHREKKLITAENRKGEITEYPIMSISVVAVTNEERELISHVQIAEIVAGLKKESKQLSGSNYLRDNRISGA